jgi:hypothetical protein
MSAVQLVMTMMAQNVQVAVRRSLDPLAQIALAQLVAPERKLISFLPVTTRLDLLLLLVLERC